MYHAQPAVSADVPGSYPSFTNGLAKDFFFYNSESENLTNLIIPTFHKPPANK